ncbi:MAG: hypothetical protein GY855_15190 [candidate division Zixibacteria bacterium]|nr:hypothetical protein [candidate division Zixibacteria bacterium]
MPSISYLMTHMVYAYPRQLNSFLSMIDWDSLTKIRNIVRLKPGPPDLIPIHNQLKALVDIHYQSSQFFKQHFRPILNKHPVYIKNLYNNEKLKDITAGFYSDLTTLPTLRERIEQIGDYYDLEFVRISLQAMADISCEVTDAEFTEFCDRYALSLYEFCLQEVHISLGYSMHTHDLFALYATGGHAREQGFDDDYDMIAILDSSDPEHIDYCNKIVGKMNSEILKRGILPHHRFADHFGSYIVQFDQLAEYLSGSGEELFIDKSQVLSSRMLVGSSKLENKLQNEIISPYIFSKGGEYIEEMKGEMKSRHNTNEERHKYDIKECRGGLRDIEMLLLIYKTKYEVRDPLSRKFLQRLTELEPDHKQEFKYIEEHLNFIKKLRDLYRLKIAAHNVLDRDYLTPVADSMNYGNDDAAAKALCNDFLTRTSEASRVINKLIDSVKL